MSNKVGRPSEYRQEIADKICEELALGKSLRTVCSSEETPSIATVFKWMRDYPEFLNQYARAKEESTDALAEEIQDISDDALNDALAGGENKAVNAIVNAHRMRIDTRKWLMSKMKPKKYGDKMDVTTDGKPLVVSFDNAFTPNEK